MSIGMSVIISALAAWKLMDLIEILDKCPEEETE